METLYELSSPKVRALFWRDEIPEAMLWLQSEGFGDKTDPELLKRFLSVGPEVASNDFDGLVQQGLLGRTRDGRYELTEEGRSHAQRVLAEDFAELDRMMAAPTSCGCCTEGVGSEAGSELVSCGCCGGETSAQPARLQASCGCCGETSPEPPSEAYGSCGCCGSGDKG